MIPNHNGIYNGMNLAGLDIARLYLALRKNPSLTIPQFLSDEETFYKVTLPKSRHFELPRLYPWMLAGKRNEQIIVGGFFRAFRCAAEDRTE